MTGSKSGPQLCRENAARIAVKAVSTAAESKFQSLTGSESPLRGVVGRVARRGGELGEEVVRMCEGYDCVIVR